MDVLLLQDREREDNNMKAIAAMAGDRVIGLNTKIPWKNSLDMRFFKAMTLNHPVIVGRTTYEKMGPLKDRYHYVLSDSKNGKYTEGGTEYIAEFLTFDQLTKKKDLDDAWVIGGAKVYKQLLPLCSELYMTHIIGDYEGDTYMPEFEHLFDDQQIIYEGKDMWVVHYWKQEWKSYENAYRFGFDAKLMGKDGNENPYELSHHPRDTTYDDECNFQWSQGYDDAPWVWKMNYV